MTGNSLELLNDARTNYVDEERYKTIKLECTKSGRPAKFESGGAISTGVGHATIVCGPHGEKMLPTYIKKTGQRANSEHALFVVFPGVLIIEAERDEDILNISVFKIKDITEKEGKFEARVVKILECAGGEWDKEHLRERFADAIEAVKRKASCYHCREIHFGLEMRVRDANGPDA